MRVTLEDEEVVDVVALQDVDHEANCKYNVIDDCADADHHDDGLDRACYLVSPVDVIIV